MKACLRCGFDGPDVRSTIVRYDDPIDVMVSIPNDATRTSFDHRSVPGRYGKEWRCQDRPACDGRLAALEPMPPAEPTPAVAGAEGATWFD